MSMFNLVKGNLSHFNPLNNKIASIDIGWKNFVIYTRTTQGGILKDSSVLYKNLGGSDNYSGLSELLKDWSAKNIDLDGIIVEHQLEKNFTAIRMCYFLVGFLSSVDWQNDKCFISFLDARLKTLAIHPFMFAYRNRVALNVSVRDNSIYCRDTCISKDSAETEKYLEMVKSRGKAVLAANVKIDTIPVARKICARIGDLISAAFIEESRKKDDIADTICQLEAFLLYLEVLQVLS